MSAEVTFVDAVRTALAEEMERDGRVILLGEDIGVYYFADNDARDSFVDLGSGFGGNYLVGDGWAVDATNGVLDELEASIDGASRP